MQLDQIEGLSVKIASPVPEPSTFLLLGGGLAGLVFVARQEKERIGTLTY